MLSRLKTFQKEYRIIRILGRGSYGEVALARSRITKKQFALKFYSITQLTKTNKLYSVKRSMKIVQSLKSPYIIKLYDYMYDGEKLLLQYEACRFGNLQEYLKRNRSRSEEISKELICQMAEILDYLSSVQVVHRDIKPSNMVFGEEGFLKLIDFDEAITFNQSLISEQEDFKIMKMKYSGVLNLQRRNPDQLKLLIQDHHSRSREQTYVGTPCYMPPEMKENRNYDEKGDLWSLGCIIFEILTGETYFTDEDNQSNSSEERKSERLTNHEKDLGEEASSLLSKILFRNPCDRPSVSQILSHSYLREYRGNKQQREAARGKIARELTSFYDVKEEVEEEGEVSLKYDPFFAGFQILKEIKVCSIVLKRGWYFFSPTILKSSQKSFDFYDEFEHHLLQSVPFLDVTSLLCNKDCVELCTNSSKLKLKHILPQMNQKLRESMKYVIDAFIN